MAEYRKQFNTAQDDARIRSTRDALVRAVQVGAALGIAIGVPAPWWVRILLFLGVMFVIGVIVQFRKIHRPA